MTVDEPKPGDPRSDFDRPFTPSDRVAWLVIAVPFGAIGLWMFWVFDRFLAGPGWIEFTIRMILEELAFAAVLFAVALIAVAVGPRDWRDWVFNFAAAKLFFAVTVVVGLSIASLVVLLLLLWLGILK